MTNQTGVHQSAESDEWPPLIYNAHVPWYTRVRDFVITLLGWLLIVDLLEDIWVLFTQWLNVSVFKRTVELEHLLQTLWSNIHQFFYLSFAFAAVILLVGMSRYRELRRPVERLDRMQGESQRPVSETKCQYSVPRMVNVMFDEHGNMVGISPAPSVDAPTKPSRPSD